MSTVAEPDTAATVQNTDARRGADSTANRTSAVAHLVNKEVLPASFQQRRRAQHVLYHWSFVVFVMFALLCGLTTFHWIRGRQIRWQRDLTFRAALPIEQDKQRVSHLEILNKLQAQRIKYVKSAEPDDSALQTLLAISKATQASNHRIHVQDVWIDIAKESPSHSGPTGAGRMMIRAEVESDQSALEWLQRMKKIDRLQNIQLSQQGNSANDNQVQLQAVTQSTKVAP